MSDEEFRQAQDDFAQCVEAQSGIVTFGDDYSKEVVGAPGSGFEGAGVPVTIVDGCAEGTLSHLEPVFIAQRFNPLGLNPSELIRSCVSDGGGVLPEGASDEEIGEMRERVLAGTEQVEPVVAVCMVDPTGQYGITEESVAGMLAGSPQG